ncbi:MAG: hypothetical protein A3B15_02015 [Candidatus Buchananbacteria bacterium RIFCSPLOWO2_01_FULL_45_31]|uniref:Peptidase S8/S53 domain-containing protein n=1 Tax=Candidatus Buchananbacteria bacterium RIFCSPLOWO2_01_FULL_45_31 TaxID=1797545 RepID=A0A1G1YNC9_9BACT|nr:MAG: hypothetical protein A3B15_02015 [Candidatus Buchananbacteria bacterium RIFCSPLOWO2_01_FULL_45_31]
MSNKIIATKTKTETQISTGLALGIITLTAVAAAGAISYIFFSGSRQITVSKGEISISSPAENCQAFTDFTGKTIYRDCGIDFENNLISGLPSLSDLTGEKNYQGYIIEFDKDPVLKKKAALEKEARANQALKAKDVSAKVQSYAAEINRQHDALKTKIKNSISIGAAKSADGKLKLRAEYKKAFNGIALDISNEEANKIKQIKGIKRVYPNYEVNATLMDSVPLINADDVWRLDEDGSDCATSGKSCLTGEGVTIAIIDTGIDYTHPDLGGCFGTNCKVAGGYDFVNNDNNPMDDMGHGTHVAATAAGNGVLNGVAPGAKLYSYKVLNYKGSGTMSIVIEGIERAVDPNLDGDFSDIIDVISLSLGGFGNPDDPQSQAIDNAVDAGIVAVVAAGNSGPEERTIKSPGTARKAITVGAVDKSDTIGSFSSRGPVIWEVEITGEILALIKPDVIAPGVSICAAQYDSAWNNKKCFDNSHVAISGTSMATPHITGAVALLKQKNPDWTPQEIKAALKTTAINLGLPPAQQGAGRIDVLGAVELENRPLIAELAPIDYIFSGAVDIIGTAKGEGLERYEVYYSEKDLGIWNLICQGNNEVETGVLCAGFDSYNSGLIEGKYELKLVVSGIGGRINEDRNVFEIDFFKITEPMNNDIYRAGDTINLAGTIGGNFSNYIVEFSEMNSGIWETDGITLVNGGANPIVNDVFATWNTVGLGKGFYDLKLTVNYASGETFEEIISEIYLDPTLKQGWPVHIDYRESSGGRYWWGGFFHPVVSDINNDGNKEIIVYRAGQPTKIFVYDSNGSLLWSVDIGTEEASGNLPLVGDLDNDGFKEIIALNYGGFNAENSDLYAFNYNGSLLWQSAVTKFRGSTMLMADLNNDGNKEIVIKGISATISKMSIVNNQGAVVSSWDITNTEVGSSIESYPAVGNFDDDNDLEIVAAGPSENEGPIYQGDKIIYWKNEGVVYVYNMDGSIVSGWPQYVRGAILSSPVVGDINSDGFNEIVVGLIFLEGDYGCVLPCSYYGGLYAFDKNGNILPGWPVKTGKNFWSTAALGDVNKDGNLEIAASHLEDWGTFLFNYQGEVMPGWPQDTVWGIFYGLVMGDINGDNNLEIIAGSGGNYNCPEDCGGVYAWNATGSLLNGFPKVTEADAQAPAVIDDIDNDGKMELIASSDWDYDFFAKKYKYRGSIYVWDLDGSYNANKMPWPMFQHDTQHTGLYFNPLVDLEIKNVSSVGTPEAPALSFNLCMNGQTSLADIGLGAFTFKSVTYNQSNEESQKSQISAGGVTVQNLKNGQCIFIKKFFLAPGQIPEFNAISKVTLKIDPDSSILETDKTNNNFTFILPVDLLIKDVLSVGTAVAPALSFNLCMNGQTSLADIGLGAFTFESVTYNQSNEESQKSQINWGGVTVQNLKNGQCAFIKEFFLTPSQIPEFNANPKITLKIDPGNSILETDKTNNNFTLVVTVVNHVSITDCPSPCSWQAGTSHELMWTFSHFSPAGADPATAVNTVVLYFCNPVTEACNVSVNDGIQLNTVWSGYDIGRGKFNLKIDSNILTDPSSQPYINNGQAVIKVCPTYNSGQDAPGGICALSPVFTITPSATP